VSSNKISIEFRHKPYQWAYIKTGFWASARSDLVVGAVTVSKFHLTLDFGSLRANTYSVFANFTKPFANFNGAIMRAYLSGYTQKSGT
jgi:hypothetical protein